MTNSHKRDSKPSAKVAWVLVIFFAIVLLALSGNVYARQPIVEGKAHIIDGDTLYMQKHKIRLSGIDAPELAQTCKTDTGKPYACGKVSRNYLAKIAHNKTVHCKIDGTDRYKRLLGTCYINGININSLMVTNGWAIPYYKLNYMGISNNGILCVCV